MVIAGVGCLPGGCCLGEEEEAQCPEETGRWVWLWAAVRGSKQQWIFLQLCRDLRRLGVGREGGCSHQEWVNSQTVAREIGDGCGRCDVLFCEYRWAAWQEKMVSQQVSLCRLKTKSTQTRPRSRIQNPQSRVQKQVQSHRAENRI